jgi:hypothetical protein
MKMTTDACHVLSDATVMLQLSHDRLFTLLRFRIIFGNRTNPRLQIFPGQQAFDMLIVDEGSTTSRKRQGLFDISVVTAARDDHRLKLFVLNV